MSILKNSGYNAPIRGGSSCLKVHFAILKIGQVMRMTSPRMLFRSAATGVIIETPKLQSEATSH